MDNNKSKIRGMRIRVEDVLSYLYAGMTVEEVLDDFPYLTQEDIIYCFSISSEIKELESLLELIPEENVIERMSLQHRLESVISELQNAVDEASKLKTELDKRLLALRRANAEKGGKLLNEDELDEALETQIRFRSFADDWDAPGMEAYDEADPEHR
jgi:uncharacterized protein (DUF433 family)